jgi:hypothetical protein
VSWSRLVLRDELTRYVQVADPSSEITRQPPRILHHRWFDPMAGLLVDPVGRLSDDPMTRRDGLVYRLADVKASRDLLGLMFDGFEPVVRFDRGGRFVSVVDETAASYRAAIGRGRAA